MTVGNALLCTMQGLGTHNIKSPYCIWYYDCTYIVHIIIIIHNFLPICDPGFWGAKMTREVRENFVRKPRPLIKSRAPLIARYAIASALS